MNELPAAPENHSLGTLAPTYSGSPSEQQQLPVDPAGRFVEHKMIGNKSKAIFVGSKGGRFYRSQANRKVYL